MHPNERQWEQFYEKVKGKTGLDLFQYKPDQLRRRILGMLEQKNAANLDEFWATLSKTPDGATWFLDKLAINVSELYRNPEKWVEMQEAILPKLIRPGRGLKAWSAGCSIGAEAHTLASILESSFPGRHQIVGSDIDQEALNQAKSGLYSDADMKCVPNEIKAKYFLQEGAKWKAKSEITRHLQFKTGDLLSDRFDTGFDLIMCRNVVIYFTDEAKDRLYRRFFDSLRPGGVLFVGSTERIFNSKDIGFETNIPFFYTKPAEGDQQWRSAS